MVLTHKEEIEPQEILLDSLSQRKIFFEQNKLEVPLDKRSFKLFLIFFLMIILGLFLKAFQLQILQGDYFSDLAEKNYHRVYFERASRGVIYDRNFEQIVFNESSFDLVCYKLDLPRSEQEKYEIFQRVSDIIGLDPEQIKEKINISSSDKVLIEQDLDREILIAFDANIAKDDGFSIEENIKRKSVSGELFSHIVGFIGRVNKEDVDASDRYSLFDYIGKSGLEKSYENILSGNKGETVVDRDVFREELLRREVSEPEPGKSLVLWSDLSLQKKMSEALNSALKQANAFAGVAIAMDAKTGGILGLVSLPALDNNIFFEKLSVDEWDEIVGELNNPFWNRAVSATYPTGSTIKPLIAVTALEQNIISPNKEIFCDGQIDVPNPWYPDQPWIFHDWATHGWTNMRKAIAESCNVYFYTIGGGYGDIKGLGPERIEAGLKIFGWGEFTGIDIPGERKGLIPSPDWKEEYFQEASEKIWLPGDTYNLAIGQGYLSITPIQVTSAFVAIANNGTLLKPMLVKQVIDENKDVIKTFDTEIIRDNIASQENLAVVQQGMRDAVIYGSSYILNDLPVKVAAKTGTAQTSKNDFYHNWVTVFAPYNDPEIVLTIMIENVPEERVVVLPAAKEILEWYFRGK